MLRFLKVVGAILSIALFGAIAWDLATYDAKAWSRDYAGLKKSMAQNYANLDWIVEHRRLDLKELDHSAADRIGSAYSRVQALLALRDFTEAFRDPHLKFVLATDAPVPGPPLTQSEPADVPAGQSCEEAGYEEGEHGFEFPLAEAAGWRPVSGGNFPTGMLGDTAVLRIARFGEDQYLATCQAVFKPGIGKRALQLQVRSRLQQELTAALRTIKRRGAGSILIDLTGNGGGTEWVSEAVALFTDRKLVRAASRHVGPSCDRSGVWRGRAACPVLLPAGPPLEIDGIGAWTGPMTILVDRGTGSASEDFVAWLQQNKVARVAGGRTAGAGCGYVNGGAGFLLQEARLYLRMPNCARFLNNGVNEIEGIAPDVALDMEHPEEAIAELDRLLN